MTTLGPAGQAWLSESLATRDLERVKPDMAAAGHRINEAASHVRSARTLAKDDVTVAMSACHDAIRKAIARTCQPTDYARAQATARTASSITTHATKSKT